MPPKQLRRWRMQIRRSLRWGALAAAALTGSGLLSASGAMAQQEPPRAGGQYWFGRYGCTACHGGDGKGTLIGVPVVARPDSTLTADFITRQIRTPRDVMPDFSPEVVSDEKLQALITYIGTLEARASAAASASPKPAASASPKPAASKPTGGAD